MLKTKMSVKCSFMFVLKISAETRETLSFLEPFDDYLFRLLHDMLDECRELEYEAGDDIYAAICPYTDQETYILSVAGKHHYGPVVDNISLAESLQQDLQEYFVNIAANQGLILDISGISVIAVNNSFHIQW
ncbi:hypothetical protein [Egyptian fruit bat adenovirus]|uniref:Uncharacterized protein n=1 Tax=Egyptian fruit bat adenovirus TaxID=2849732 RepID=A0A344X9W1_9ADEN|nr:hypothetical protein QKD41_gp24 [Rousettus aegyptiacus adenovirus]AXE75643.1 hypothetical protein [Egyptian fruit bat adenovirus]